MYHPLIVSLSNAVDRVKITTTLYVLSQKNNLIQTWRNISRWTVASLDILPKLLTKINKLNHSGKEREQAVKVGTIRQHQGLLNEDYSEFSYFILKKEHLSNSEVKSELIRLKLRRLAKWHVYGAPDDVIVPERSMLSVTLGTLYCLILCYRRKRGHRGPLLC